MFISDRHMLLSMAVVGAMAIALAISSFAPVLTIPFAETEGYIVVSNEAAKADFARFE